MAARPPGPSVGVRCREEVIEVNAIYVIFWSAVVLLALPVLAAVVLTLGPVAFVVLLMAGLAVPIALVAGAISRRS
jgi:hypothetical protein